MHPFVWADNLHAHIVRWKWLYYFTAATRLLLAAGFIIPSLPKITNQPFTQLGPDTPVGYYFDALHHTGFYYQFIGYGQLLAGLLLLIPFTASLGAVLYFPIILNIFVLTVSIDFAGTPFITGLMLLGNLYLLCWDYDRWRGILPSWQRTRRMFDLRGYLLWGGLFGLCAIFGATGLAYLNVAMLRQDFVPLLISAIIGGVGFGIAVHWHAQRLVKQ